MKSTNKTMSVVGQSGLISPSFSRDYLENAYHMMLPNYQRLTFCMQLALRNALVQENIKILDVTSRIKELDSFLNKAFEREGSPFESKARPFKYKDPLNEISDICGLRIIHFFQSDRDKICEIVRRIFHVVNEKPLNADAPPTSFVLQEDHIIVRLKDDWASIPPYIGLSGLKAEVQIRTPLIHVWAEIEHPSYKLESNSGASLPSDLRRAFSRQLAILQSVDSGFDKLRTELSEYESSLKLGTAMRDKAVELFNSALPLNITSLQAFLDFYFPKGKKSAEYTENLWRNLSNYGLDFQDLVEACEIFKIIQPQVEPDILSALDIPPTELRQMTYLKAALYITNEKYWDNHKKFFENRPNILDRLIRWREKLPGKIAYCRLGHQDSEGGINGLCYIQDRKDGKAIKQRFMKKMTRRTDTKRKQWYIYFKFSDRVIEGFRKLDRVQILVEFFDLAKKEYVGNSFNLDYDAKSSQHDDAENIFRPSHSVQFTNRNVWRFASFIIDNGRFERRQHGHADFRISCHVSTNRTAQQNLYVSKVIAIPWVRQVGRE
jgi:putative GTP pyrophosphokinase